MNFDIKEGLIWKNKNLKQKYKYATNNIETVLKCQKCGKKTYQAETITYERIPYHLNCLRCLDCKKRLSAAFANPFGNDVFLCDIHYKRAMLQINKYKVHDKTPRLIKKKSEIPSDLSSGYEWRKKGLKQKYLYKNEFKNNENSFKSPKCQSCGKIIYPAEMITYDKIPYHPICFRCLKCNVKLKCGDANPYGNETFLCEVHFKSAMMRSYNRSEANLRKVVSTCDIKGKKLVDFSDGLEWKRSGVKQIYNYKNDIKEKNYSLTPKCNKCGKKVYCAEMILYDRIPYHKSCFKCVSCNKSLPPSQANPFGNENYLCDVHYKQICSGIIVRVNSRIKIKERESVVSQNILEEKLMKSKGKEDVKEIKEEEIKEDEKEPEEEEKVKEIKEDQNEEEEEESKKEKEEIKEDQNEEEEEESKKENEDEEIKDKEDDDDEEEEEEEEEIKKDSKEDENSISITSLQKKEKIEVKKLKETIQSKEKHLNEG